MEWAFLKPINKRLKAINMDLIFLGIQACGKGTQARILAEQFGFVVLEMGKECRKIGAMDTEYGRHINEILKSGKLLPASIPVQIAEEFLKNLPSDKQAIFDGFPRSSEQATPFFETMKKLKRDYLVVHFLLDENIVIERLAARLLCPVCGMTNPVVNGDDICKKCGGKMTRRAEDDNTASIKERTHVFETDIMPVIDGQRALGKVIEIDASQSIEFVTKDLADELKNKGVL